MRAFRRAVLLAAAVSMSGCGGGSTEPTDFVPFVVVFVPSNGTYTFDGQTFAGGGFHNVALPEGLHEITGAFSGPELVVEFSAIGSGGVVSGSVASEAGPGPTTGPCGVTYASSEVGTKTFRIQFAVSAAATNVCE